MPNSRWNKPAVEKLTALAASGMFASQIAAEFNTTVHAVITVAGMRGIRVNKFSSAELAEMETQTRERARVKRQKQRHKEVTERHKALGLPAVSKTSPAYRNQLPTIGNCSKADLQAMLRQAVLNTQGARA